MSKESAFWDASAIVLLCVQEETSHRATLLVAEIYAGGVVGSPVEVCSAIARLCRLGKLNDIEKPGALSRLDLLSRGWRGILPADNLRDPAKSLLDRHELRQPIAYNSLRL